MKAYVDQHAGMAVDGWSAAWTFDLDHWGTCGQGPDDDAALADLATRCGLGTDALDAGTLKVVERVDRARSGDETVFDRDRVPASEAEREATLGILDRMRARTLELVRDAPARVLAYRDPDRVLPVYAWWHTVGQLALHIADTESRYYLPLLGLPARERANDLVTELEQSGAHVRRVVSQMAPDLASASDQHGSWTSVKVLRRLAWHERGELDVLERLVEAAAVEKQG
ncbi:DinB family protein [Promicromonospora sp. NPDC057138]|uniref:DinB family protein n=1 Tax=Promicromonospora sp. NPDC057138 TaxID=3346031 RepID=UPI003638B06E